MPNPKSGTVTLEVGKATKEIKAGKVDFKVDKTGIIHSTVGRASFTPEKITENVLEILQVIAKLKPTSAKGAYFRTIHLSTTMSPSIIIDKSSVAGI